MANGKRYDVGPEMNTNDAGFCAIEFLIDTNLTVRREILG